MLDIVYIAVTLAFFGLMLALRPRLRGPGPRDDGRGGAAVSASDLRRASIALLLLVYLVYALLRPEKF